MIRLLVYIPPVLLNYILGGVFFITAHRFSQSGQGAMLTTATMATWGIVYAICSFFISRITTKSNAPKLVIASGIGITLSSLGFIFVPQLYCQFIWLTTSGIATAFCITPFQVFMKSIEPDQSTGVIRATSLYTFSWSCGIGAGPFIFGILDDTTGFVINGIMGIIISLIIAGVVKFYHPTKRVPTNITNSKDDIYKNRPDLAKLGWIVGRIGTFAVAIVRTLVPFRAELTGISRGDAGTTLALVSFVQGFTALALIRGKYWMYKFPPALLISIAGIIGLIGFAFSTSVKSFMFSAIIYGIYSGCAYFCLVFYSLIHPTKSAHYVGINEIVVGVSSIIGPLLCGGIATISENASTPFVAGAFLIVIVIIIQAKLLSKLPRI